MAELRVIVNGVRSENRAVPVAGTEITVDGQVLEGVVSAVLDAPDGGAWTLRLEVLVDPATLFVSKWRAPVVAGGYQPLPTAHGMAPAPPPAEL